MLFEIECGRGVYLHGKGILMEELKIDLRGLDVNEQECEKILEAARKTLIQILIDKAHPNADLVVALGPGWIGIEGRV